MTSPIKKILNINPYWIVAGVLMLSLVLAYAKPSIMYLAKREDKGYGLSADYGIPIKWGLHKDPGMIMPPIPFDSVGLDYINADVYIRCAGPGMNIYRTICVGDPHGRRFLHPPLAPLLFGWITFLPVETALGIWSLCILLIAFFGSLWCINIFKNWLGSSEIGQGYCVFLSFLFTVSYPVIFAYERGNNSILIFLLFVAASFCYVRKSWFWLGIALTVATLLKLFPLPLWSSMCIMAIWLLILSITKEKYINLRSSGFKLLAGKVSGLLLIAAPLFREYEYYLFHHFPASTPHLGTYLNSVNDHALKFAFGNWGFDLGVALWIVATICLIRSTMKWILDYENEDARNKGLMAFVFLAALCSYLMPRGASYDYHLVTNIPLLCLLSFYPARYSKPILRISAFFMIIGYALPRWMNDVVFGVPIYYLKGCLSFFLIFQVISLVLLAVYFLKPEAQRRNLISNG